MFFLSSISRHTDFALVTGVQTCALPVNDRTAGALRITAIDAAVEGAIRALPLLRHIICDLRVGLSKTGFTKSRGDREILTHQIQAKGPLARFRLRSEERRGGKGGVSTSSFRGWRYL